MAAYFYGVVQGARGEASRLGTKGSGLSVMAASWAGRINVRLYEQDGVDRYTVSMDRHGQSRGWGGTIASGVLGEMPELQGVLPTPTIESFTDEAIAAEVKRRFNFELVLRKGEPS